jgi:hypothetical protein
MRMFASFYWVVFRRHWQWADLEKCFGFFEISWIKLSETDDQKA